MLDQTNIQGENPVGGPERKPISADSFRRLTSLLKKPAAVVVAQTPQITALPPPEILSLPAFVMPEVVEPKAEIEAVQSNSPEVEAIAAPELEVEAEVIAAAEPVVLSTAEIESLATLHDPVAELADLAPAKPRRSFLHKTKVDAFALVPDQLAQTIKPKVEVNTPEQDAEAAELARSLLDMMAASSSGGQPQERALAADTLLRMIPRLPTRAKIVLAERLCIMEAPPPFLISKLIADPEQTVAAPLLEDCSNIPDEDLFQTIESGDVAKRRMMARRRKISRPIAEALAKTGDESVVLTLARNQGAEIPQEGFDAIAKMVPNNPDLLAPLCTRKDLPVHFAFELFWLAPAQLRRYLLSRFLTDSELLTKILKITMDTNGEDQPPSVDLEAIKSALLSGGQDCVEFFAAATKVNISTVEKILADDQGEPLMAMIKVAGLPRSQLQEILPSFIQGDKPLIDPERNLDEVQAVFDQLSFNKARILLTYWDWATLRTGPYGQLN